MKFMLIVALLIAGVIFWLSFTGPGVNDLDGNFREIDAWQNENNTGPVNRVYIVTVSDTLWSEMERYGDYMPHSKMGTTNVWFFLDSQPFPNNVIPGESPFSAVYQSASVGRYVKDNMSQSRLIKKPFQ